MERGTSSFLRRTSSKRSRIPIREAKGADSTVSIKTMEIASILHIFWAHIFSANRDGSDPPLVPEDRRPFLNNIQITLSEEKRATVDASLSVGEISYAIQSVPEKKFTGLNGIRNELFKIHTNKLAKIL